MTRVFMFPGQSSRDAGMLARALLATPARGAAIVARASEVVGRDLAAHYASSSPLETNRDVQVGVFLASHLHLVAVEAAGVDAPLSLGLSLGEYNHLVHIGALGFEDALALVDARGAAYDAAPEGAMAAVFPIDLEALEAVVVQARAHGFLAVSNFNSPTQHVIAGERAALDAALAILEDEHYVHGRIIESRVAMHTARMASAAAAFRPALERARWQAPSKPYIPNVLGEQLEAPTASQICELLVEHICRPVRWRASIEQIAASGDATFIEVGPGTQLVDLLRRKWLTCPRYATERPEGLGALLGTKVIDGA